MKNLKHFESAGRKLHTHCVHGYSNQWYFHLLKKSGWHSLNFADLFINLVRNFMTTALRMQGTDALNIKQ
jgi:hypothetical protein